ncbi:hypothetical protein [Maridesulfovibrio salexigens]|uniref:Uncharacterized protein n=1 Tax=Maridesulfovibrio salexigens (strain ATCC 14822 / DSM 2638 / NCIMB 8403 / VKM B-1763) TaxID=526222 RepID=C6C1L3_MARSD|nr:hypothetical protein [Maridesulfovibrio salexigens]ACS81188.1 hypothetical protein Desal_3137 [Maridesulfovibrio salexigens DSM 2638]
MDTTIADLIKFNEFLDSTLDPNKLDEEFITLRQAELDGISKDSDIKHFPFIALSYAKLMELTVLLAGKYADNCQNVDFGDLVINPRHLDVCILNAALITEDYGVTENLPLWFKKQVRECTGSQYSEDLGKMVVDPFLLSHFVERGLLLRIVKKERHRRLSDQFRNCIPYDPQSTFSKEIEEFTRIAHNPVKDLGCMSGMIEGLDVASWLASNTVLNVVKGCLKNDLMTMLLGAMSDDYLKSINKKFEKAHNTLAYISMGRKNFANYPYDEKVPIAEWAEINNTLCHFNLDRYGMIQSELNRSLSNPCYKSPFLNRLLYSTPTTQDTNKLKHNVMFQHHLPCQRDHRELTI